jgi:hypothetical protein
MQLLIVSITEMGIGMIARYHYMSAIVMLCASKEYISDPTMVEAVAAWKALVCRLDLQGIMLEGDSLDIVLALRKNRSC